MRISPPEPSKRSDADRSRGSTAHPVEVQLSDAEAKALLAKNVAIRAWLKPTSRGLVLVADVTTVKQLGFVDFAERMEAEMYRRIAGRR